MIESLIDIVPQFISEKMLNNLIELILMNFDNGFDLKSIVIKNINFNANNSIAKLKFSFMLGSRVGKELLSKD